MKLSDIKQQIDNYFDTVSAQEIIERMENIGLCIDKIVEITPPKTFQVANLVEYYYTAQAYDNKTYDNKKISYQYAMAA